jgi:hypothetical protein
LVLPNGKVWRRTERLTAAWKRADALSHRPSTDRDTAF